MNKKEIQKLKDELDFYRRHSKLSLCKSCNLPITSNQNKVTVVLMTRKEGITWRSHNLATYHEKCYKKR